MALVDVDRGRARPTGLPPVLEALDAASLALWWFTAQPDDDPRGRLPTWANAAAVRRGEPPGVGGRPVAELVADALAGVGPVVPTGPLTLHAVPGTDGVPRGVLVVLDDRGPGTDRPPEAAAQRVLLPVTLPLLARARVSGAYRAANRAGAAGGDWYDAVAVGGGRLAFAVGDGTGAGLGAAAAMSRLRGAWLAEVHRDPDPGVVLTALDRLAAGMDDVRGSALCTGLLDTRDGTLRWAAAGSPTPVVAVPGEAARRAPGGTRPPLGSVPGAPVPVHAAHLPEGAVLVLASDGALTVPDRTPEEAWAALLRAAAEAADRPRDATADGRLADTVTRDTVPAAGADDDTAVLVVLRVAPVADLALELSAVPASLPVVRRSLDRWLGAFGMGEAEQAAVQVAVGEACANAVEHAYAATGPGLLWVGAQAGDDGRLTVTVSDAGRWRTPDRDPGDRGRGLLIMRQLSDDVVLRARPGGGTTVRLQVRLSGVPEPEGETWQPDGAPPVEGGADPVEEQEGAARVDRSGAVPVVTAVGVLDPHSAPQLRIRLLEASRGGAVPARLDLRSVTEVSSAVVAVVLQVARVARTGGWELEVLAPRGSVARHVLDLAGVGAVARLG